MVDLGVDLGLGPDTAAAAAVGSLDLDAVVDAAAGTAPDVDAGTVVAAPAASAHTAPAVRKPSSAAAVVVDAHAHSKEQS